jgi:hypothetical protein
MKIITNISGLAVMFLSSCIMMFLAGCEKDDSATAFGNSQIYMPQSTIAAGRLAVPNTGIGLDSATRNFKLENDSVKIILGVARSGLAALERYEVGISASVDTVSRLISSSVFPAATTIALPADIYTLPSSITVPENQSGQTFYLSIHRSKLKAYAGKTALVRIGISGASKYTISPAANSVLLVININGLNL